MNKHFGTIKRWRVQVLAITRLAYAAFYFTRKAFSVAKLGIGEDPNFHLDEMAMANLDGIYLAAYAVGQFMLGILADRFGPRVVVLGGLIISALAALVMGTYATLPIFATCMLIQGLAQSTGWSGLCKNIGSFFPAEQRGRVLALGLVYFMLKPARYAILLWGAVIVFEQMPHVGKVGAAIIPTAFELAGLLGPIMIGMASDNIFGARRMPACILSLLALTVSLAFFMGALHSGSVALVVALLFVMGLIR